MKKRIVILMLAATLPAGAFAFNVSALPALLPDLCFGVHGCVTWTHSATVVQAMHYLQDAEVAKVALQDVKGGNLSAAATTASGIAMEISAATHGRAAQCGAGSVAVPVGNSRQPAVPPGAIALADSGRVDVAAAAATLADADRTTLHAANLASQAGSADGQKAQAQVANGIASSQLDQTRAANLLKASEICQQASSQSTEVGDFLIFTGNAAASADAIQHL